MANDTQLDEDREYVYRWYCDACDETGDWHEDAATAHDYKGCHIGTHGNASYEPLRIQRFKKSEVDFS